MPFNDETGVVVARTDGAGPPRRGWLGGAGGSIGAPGGRLAGVVWFLSRHGRYGRAVMLHQHLRERREVARRSRRPSSQAFVLGSGRRLDTALLRRWTVRAAIGWALAAGRLSRRRPRREAVIGALAAPLALPAAAVTVVVVAVLLVADLGLWALSLVGGSVRTAVVPPPGGARPADDAFARTPSHAA